MKLLDVYPLYDVTPVSGLGATITDQDGQEYLDFYGGHAVISIGHRHPHYVARLEEQLHKLTFYSNSIQNPLQSQLANLLAELSGCHDYDLFLCNSGAEANENALKLASFITGKKRVISFQNGFHGRTSGAVAATDNDKIKAPYNQDHHVSILSLEDKESLQNTLAQGDVCGIIIESVQGIGGLGSPSADFFSYVAEQAQHYGALLIADEVQSGYGRTGKFFGYQHFDVSPDIITVAKGMGNGFPIGGVLLKDSYPVTHGMLGTTFGGNHLACAAGIAVLEVIAQENLIEHAAKMGDYLYEQSKEIDAIKSVEGLGLMCGLSFDEPIRQLRKELIFNQHVFTGSSKKPNQLRILPPLNITEDHIDTFYTKLKNQLS